MWYDISNQSKHAQEREKERAIIMATRYFAALDVGGTKADAVLFTESGEIVAHVIDPAGIPFDHGLETTTSNCKRTLDKLFSYADGPIETLYCAIATVEYYHPQFVEFFSKNFSVKKFRLEGDGCSLISSMLGHNDGACMVCGTGSALFVRRGDEYWHLGGGGHLIDSCGSGFSIGRYAIQAVLRAHDGSAEKTMLTELLDAQAGREMWNNMVEIYAKGRSFVASFAPNVFLARRRGDLVARNIFNTCASDMANVVWSAYRDLGGPFDLVLNGGIFRNFPEYAEAVRALSPPDVRFIFSEIPPIYGCAVEAMYDAGLSCDEAFKKTFQESYKK